jgi:hypothetical protein
VFLHGTLPGAGPLLLATVTSAGIFALAYRLYRAQRPDLVDAL